jgi:enamine deaminase RidA (YjgF/YER057c/UK114 family)
VPVKSIDPAGQHPEFSFHLGTLVTGATQLLFLSGQVGDRAADLGGQLTGSLDEIARLAALAGMTLANIVNLRIYTTDMPTFLTAWPILRDRFLPAVVPANTVLEVSRFAHPGTLVELEAIAAL